MGKLDALKEAVSEKLFEQEPLAAAVMFYLDKRDPAAHREILELFDGLIGRKIESMIQEALENDKSAKLEGFN